MKEKRSHRTRWTVRAADRIAAACITVGGVGTILAVSAVFVFLVSVVVPLFLPGEAETAGTSRDPLPNRVRHLGIDEYRVGGWTFADDGRLRTFRLDTGDTLATTVLVPPDSLAASAYDVESGMLSVAFADGSIRLFHVGYRTDYPARDEVPASAASLRTGAVEILEGAVVERTADGALRRQRLAVEAGGEIPVGAPTSILAVDHIASGAGFLIAALTANDSLILAHVDRRENEFTGEVSLAIERRVLEAPLDARGARLLIAEAGNAVYVIDSHGHAAVVDARLAAAPAPPASADIAEGGDIRAVSALLGRSTIIVGDASGRIQTAFRYEAAGGSENGAPDDREIARPREFEGGGAAVTALAPSPRERLFIAGFADGHVRVFQATSGKRVVDVAVAEGAPVDAVAFAPKTDGFVAIAGGRLHHYDLDVRHPEVSLRSLFAPVWYESYPAPAHVWQSSAGTDDFEAKLGLWPLVFGTLKATFYSMLFGVPLALLAAIFTSEFISPSMRPRLKTLVESMASLPSVVLGFLAALVFAPFVQRTVPAVMVGFVMIPTVLLTMAYLWQALPTQTARRLSRFRFLMVLAALPLSIAISAGLGSWAERALFAGDLMVWLSAGTGSGFGGWAVLLLPVSAVVIIVLIGRLTGTRIREAALRSTRARVAWLDFARFGAGAFATLVLSVAAAGALTALGADPRGGIVSTYVQRNALVVGFVMGFAIIPIIYTIAEDALSAVPAHLRAASLGAGATPWQTAVRIVLPTAMSGLFSAVMIGLGRAVGETMIVLMAAGNTPVLDMNIFNGFRTLSANIAVELPEAVRDSTHYRTLFLAALLLFAMTFAVNTVAETIRLRFRKRSAQI
jgi:phosphate transport system permease protein